MQQGGRAKWECGCCREPCGQECPHHFGGKSGLFARQLAHLLRGQEEGAFDEAAEFFLADLMLGAGLGLEVLHGTVNDGQAFPVNDAQVEIALLPDLVLLEFHDRL